MTKDYFRDSLKTDLGRAIYDWSPIRKAHLPVEIAEEIIVGFCTREQRKCLESLFSTPEYPYVMIDGHRSVELYGKWRQAFRDHGYSPPILVCEEDELNEKETTK